MKIKLVPVLAALLVVGLLPPTASASRWHMNYRQAKFVTRKRAAFVCRQTSECEGSGAGRCLRRSSSRFDCVMGLFFPGEEGPEEIECNYLLHWGVARGGYISLRHQGHPHCFAIE